jgi:NADH-quinone oxidoreductase subunit C
MPLTNEHIKQKLLEKFGEQVSNFSEPYSLLTFEASKDINLKVLNFLYDEPELKFRFLTTLCGVHYPEQKGREIAVVYHLHNLEDNVRVRIQNLYRYQSTRHIYCYGFIFCGQLA